jgi:Pectate lyase superfamily protein
MVKRTVARNKRQVSNGLQGVIFIFSLIAFCPSLVLGQQPQASAGAPIYAVNAKYVNGMAPGYWPTAGSGLTLDLSAGTSYCGDPPAPVTYPGGSLTMSANATNYVYLDPSNSCAPAVSTSPFSQGQIPISNVVTGASSITTITDERTWFTPQPCGTSASGALDCAAPGANQNVTLTPNGNGATVVTNLQDKGGQVFNVKAYGARGDGTTDDTAAIQAAFNAMPAGGKLLFPPGAYKVTSLNFTAKSGWILQGVSGQVGQTQLNVPKILCSEATANTKNCIDMSGDDHVTLRDLTINMGTSTSNYPKVGLLLSKLANISATYNTVDNVDIWCPHGGIGVYNFGGEIVNWDNLEISSEASDATTPCTNMIISDKNTYGITSDYQTLPSTVSMTNNQFFGGRLDGSGTLLVFDVGTGGISDINFFSTVFGGGPSTGAAIMDSPASSGGGLSDIHFYGIRWEDDAATNCQFIDIAHTPGTLNWVIDGQAASGVQPASPSIQLQQSAGLLMHWDPNVGGPSPTIGLQVTNAAGGIVQMLNGNAGITVTSSPPPAIDTVSSAYAGATNFRGVMKQNLVTTPYSSAPNFDMSQGNTFLITLTGDATATVSNIAAGQQVTFHICQDATGGHAFNWPSNVHGGMAINASNNSTASKCDIQSFSSSSTTLYATGAGLGNL